MRKIEKQMVEAVRARRNWRSGNTAVTHDASGTAVWLHGHQIAFTCPKESRWTLAGWNTPTTRSRVNALARSLGWPGVCCKRGEPFTQGCDGAYSIRIGASDWIDA